MKCNLLFANVCNNYDLIIPISKTEKLGVCPECYAKQIHEMSKMSHLVYEFRTLHLCLRGEIVLDHLCTFDGT